jgi:drug/metabolite transporter (DMT)-like permease
MTKKKKWGILITLLTSLTYGIYPAAAHAVYEHGGDAVFMILATTFARAFGTSFFCLLKRKPLFPTKQSISLGAFGGFTQAASILGIFTAMTYLPGAIVIIIIFTSTLMILLLSAWRGEMKLDALTLAATLIALGGLSLVLNVWQIEHHYPLLGMTFAFIGALAVAARLFTYGQQMKIRHPVVIGAENFLFALAFVLPILIFKKPVFPTHIEGYFWATLCCLALIGGTFGMLHGVAYSDPFNLVFWPKLNQSLQLYFQLF